MAYLRAARFTLPPGASRYSEAAWAYRLTASTPLADDAMLRAIRAPYSRYANALRAPFVLRGDAGRVDMRRVLVLRTASDYTMPGDRGDAASLLAKDASTSGESAYREALEAAYRVASPVVNELPTHWELYGDRLPGAR
jgi:purine nucleoside permease